MEQRRNRDFEEAVQRKSERRIKARREQDQGIGFGLGMFGLVGWSVAIPAIIGLAVGLWIDSRSGSRYSWGLMGLFGGVILGCIGAWRWVKRESEKE